MSSFIILVSFILDIILSNLLPYMRENLSFFTPLIVPITIYLIYPYYKDNIKKYLILITIIGVIYDLLMTNLLFFDAILFFIIGIITIYMNKNIRKTHISNIISIILIIIIYELLEAVFFIILNTIRINLYELIYYITHSLLLNIIYGVIIYSIEKNTYELI